VEKKERFTITMFVKNVLIQIKNGKERYGEDEKMNISKKDAEHIMWRIDKLGENLEEEGHYLRKWVKEYKAKYYEKTRKFKNKNKIL
jgi:hypothetical protein